LILLVVGCDCEKRLPNQQSRENKGNANDASVNVRLHCCFLILTCADSIQVEMLASKTSVEARRANEHVKDKQSNAMARIACVDRILHLQKRTSSSMLTKQ